MKMQLLICGLALLALGGMKPSDDVQRFDRVVEPFVAAFNDSNYEALRADWNQTMREELPLARTKSFFGGVRNKRGTVEEMGRGRIRQANTCVFPLKFSDGSDMELKVVLDRADRIAGLWIRPPTPDLPVPERNCTALSLPFQGWWYVTWGGDTKELNRHHDVINQRYAFDFLVVDEEGSSHSGAGDKNEEYYAFGKEILPPARGRVTEVISGVHDCEPGTMNSYSALGNVVFIRHRPHEVSVLAHLKQGSIRVKAGQKVERGEVIGLCGNSGNSSEPHLHYHLQNTPRIEEATGIKCYLQNVRVRSGGETREAHSHSPERKEQVAPQGKKNPTAGDA